MGSRGSPDPCREQRPPKSSSPTFGISTGRKGCSGSTSASSDGTEGMQTAPMSMEPGGMTPVPMEKSIYLFYFPVIYDMVPPPSALCIRGLRPLPSFHGIHSKTINTKNQRYPYPDPLQISLLCSSTVQMGPVGAPSPPLRVGRNADSSSQIWSFLPEGMGSAPMEKSICDLRRGNGA